MFEYYVKKHAEKKEYIQLTIGRFYDFLGENLAEKVRDYFMDHHCNVYNVNTLFVFERFFTSDELEAEDWDNEYPEGENIRTITLLKLKDFLRNNGFEPYKTNEEYRLSGKSCIVPGYDGILFDVSF